MQMIGAIEIVCSKIESFISSQSASKTKNNNQLNRFKQVVVGYAARYVRDVVKQMQILVNGNEICIYIQ